MYVQFMSCVYGVYPLVYFIFAFHDRPNSIPWGPPFCIMFSQFDTKLTTDSMDWFSLKSSENQRFYNDIMGNTS